MKMFARIFVLTLGLAVASLNIGYVKLNINNPISGKSTVLDLYK